MFARLMFLAAMAAATLTPAVAGADDKISDPSLVASLRTIEHTAKGVATGQYGKKQKLLGPARTIALAWQKAATVLENAGYLVEVKQTSNTIQSFESDYATSNDPRGEAKSIIEQVKPLFELTNANP